MKSIGCYRPWYCRAHLVIFLSFIVGRNKLRDKRLKLFGIRIRDIRKSKGISQEKLAELSNTDRSYMGRIERGEKNVTLTKIFVISAALDVGIIDLFQL